MFLNHHCAQPHQGSTTQAASTCYPGNIGGRCFRALRDGMVSDVEMSAIVEGKLESEKTGRWYAIEE